MEKKVLITFFLLVLIGGLIILPDFGLTWDESIQREHGIIAWDFVNEYFCIDKVPERPWVDNQNYQHRHYGVLMQMLAFSLEEFLDMGSTRGQYILRHRMTFLWFLFASFFFYKTLRLRFKDWRLAFLGLIILFCSPRIFGHAFFNPKDTVLLSGVIISTYTLIRFIQKKNIKYALLHALTCAIVINIRIVGLIIPAFTLLFIAFEILQKLIHQHQDFKWLQLLKITSIWLLLGFALTTLFWPYLWKNPIAGLADAFKIMSEYPWKGDILLYGKLYKSTELPWFYTPAWLAATTPILWTISGVAGLFIVFRTSILSFFQERKLYRDTHRMIEVLAFGFFVGALLMVAIKKSVLYNGWRQMYFIYPSFVCLGMVAISELTTRIKKISKASRQLLYSRLLIALFAMQISTVAFFMYQYHPWYHLYFSIAAGKNRTERFEMDYWGATYKQALERLAKMVKSEEKLKIVAWHYPGEMNYKYLYNSVKDRFQYVHSYKKADYHLLGTIGPYHHEGRHKLDFPYDQETLFDLTVEGDVILRVVKIRDRK